MSRLLYISNFIKEFRRILKLPEMTMPDLAYILCSMGCHKTPDRMYYEDEVFNMLYTRTNEIKERYKRLYSEKYGTTAQQINTSTPLRTTYDVPKRLSEPKGEPVIQNVPDETNMDYVSKQLLKVDGVFYDSFKPKTVRFIRKRTNNTEL